MIETRWSDIIETYENILKSIREYETKTNSNISYEVMCNKLISSYILELLIADSNLYISNFAYDNLNLDKINEIYDIKWGGNSDFRKIDTINLSISKLISEVFDTDFSSFIQDICIQDILNSRNLSPEISKLLSSISFAIKADTAIINGINEDDIVMYLWENRANNKSSIIDDKYIKEYSNRGALIYNRIVKHKSNDKGIDLDINLNEQSEDLLNYVRDGLFCQKGVLQISTKNTNSSGTAFRISDEYALTCEHVVTNDKEIYANVIAGDGYPSERWKEDGVYDVGFGEVIYTNSALDIAIMKTEYCGRYYLEIEQEDLLPEIGEEVVVFGYPLGFEMPQTNRFGPNISFYRGYVSSNQIHNNNSITFLDIDVKSGNSGSPVLSARTGKVIGIISGAKVSGDIMFREKMPYMIPIQHFLKLIKK